MRVIGGKYRSRRLRSLPGLDLRPSADRLRETLFDVLSAGDPNALNATVWIDLFAGTGAVGIEALSRGAKMVYFVDSSSRAAKLIEDNLEPLKVEAEFQILKQDFMPALRKIENMGIQADFIFLDPPYAMQEVYNRAMRRLSDSPVVKIDSVVIAEHDKRFDPGEIFGSLGRTRKLVQGDAALSFYRRAQTR
ncbi:MAG: 16S rRNA (guanine(966)-N(2))-methyltransferase RsmD [Acidobacteriaceae bacterium]|nr:16S rRNA (guanine(966)-N(2))-methyltransferase RsmD [Acidobacteriaceae bacterium]